MATLAERTHAKSVRVLASGMSVRGYDFVPSALAEDDKDFVFRSLFPVALEAFVQNPSEEMEKDIADHIFTAQHLVVMRSDGTISFGALKYGDPRPIAFRMWNVYETEIGKAMYLAGNCVLPQWQGTGIGKEMTRYALNSEKVDWVFTVTQNPVAKQSMDSALNAVSYPLFGDLVGEAMRANGQVLATALHKEDKYNPSTMVIRRNYGGSLYGKQPTSSDWRYQSLFNKLNADEGDAYLCIHRM